MKYARFMQRGFILLFMTTALMMQSSELPAQTPVNFKIAFIGDQGLTGDSRAVLNLIRSEGAQAVVHQGDFDYADDPEAWDDQINSILGADFPYFASAGNHDEAAWSGYQQVMENRLNRLGITWDGDLGAKSSLTYRGIFIILVAPDISVGGSGHDAYIRDELAADNSIWSICSWHKNMEAMQVGGKSDETGWGVYEESRKGGAIIATAHEHSYSRTHLLSSCQNQTVASTSNTLVLSKDEAGTSQDEGRTFVFVSGLAGQSIRDQQLSGDWWASIYTSDQNANHGALFGVFNLNGEANKAHFYFKDIDGRIADDFYVTSNVTGSQPPPPSPAPTISSFNPTSGTVGTEVTVLGSNFNGATQVAINGTNSGGFTIASNSEIRIDVPVGATTGRIRVTTPAGQATSNNEFTVTQSPPPTGTGITLYPTDDAYVRSDNESDNYGSSSTLRMKDSSPVYHSYLKFVVSGLNGTVQSARLRLRVTEDSDSGGSIFLVSNAYRSSSTPWEESDITYENAPPLSGNALSTVDEVSNGEWVEFDVTAAITGSGSFSFGLENASSSTVRYSSKEGDDAPELVIQMSQTPPPPPPSGTTITLNPTEDAYVRSDDESENFGSSSSLRMHESSPVYHSYLKFVVSGVSGTVQSARLRLRVTEDSDSGGSIYLVSNAYRSSSTPWEESDLTYENAPTLSGNALSTVGEVNNGEWVEFDVTAAITGNGTFSFGLENASSSTVRYSSNEGDDAPELVIQTSGSAQASTAGELLKSGESSTLSNSAQPPDRITLSPGYPNPFNAQIVIEYALPEEAHVSLAIYNITGQLVRQLVDGMQSPGYKHTIWNGRDADNRDAGSGVYFYRLQVGAQSFVRKMILQK